MFIAITGVAIVVACLRYEMAIMLPEKEEEAQNVLFLSIASAAIFSLLTIPILWASGSWVLHQLRFDGLAPYQWMIPPYIFLSGAFMALNYWNTRSRQFGRLSFVRAAGSVGTTGSQLWSGLTGNISGGGLIAGNLVGSALSAIVLGGLIWRDFRVEFAKNVSARGISLAARRYSRFPVYDTTSSLLNTISWLLPTFFLSAYFSDQVVGYFTLSMTVLQMPMNLIGSSIAQVFFQRASQARRRGTLAALVASTSANLLMLGILPVLVLSLAGAEIFSVVFGGRWAESGQYAQIMALWIFAVFITSPISTLFSVLEKQRSSLILNLITLPPRAAALMIGGLLGDPRLALGLFSAVGVIIYAGLFVWLLGKSGVSISEFISRSARYLAYCLPILALIVLAKTASVSQEMVVMICVGCSVLYYVIIWRRQDFSLH